MDYMDLHKKSIVIDAHTDIPLDMMNKSDHGRKDVFLEYHLPLLKKGGVDIVFANLFEDHHPEGSLKEAVLQASYIYNELDKTEEVKLIKYKEDLEEVIENRKTGIILSMEGMEPLGYDISILRLFYELGVRSAAITWNFRNYYAAGTWENGGLSVLGKELVREMNSLGIIVDVSHLNEDSFWDVVDVSTRPIIASHSNAKALFNHVRNLTDNQIKAIASTGGVIGANGYFTEESGKDSLDTYMNHLEYLIEKAGEDHVGLGFDFNGYLGSSKTKGLEDATCVPSVTEELLKRGYKEETIMKVLGGNFVRVLKEYLPSKSDIGKKRQKDQVILSK